MLKDLIKLGYLYFEFNTLEPECGVMITPDGDAYEFYRAKDLEDFLKAFFED